MRSLNRRQFVKAGAALALGFGGLRRAARAGLQIGTGPLAGYGELVPDPEGVFDLPPGFRYRAVSRTGEVMDDGFLVPGSHDGMAAFPGADGRTVLVRNHELSPGAASTGPFGEDNALRERLDPALAYDTACIGGTTTLVFDTREQTLESHFLSLTGTLRNCAGGPTPWNSWVTCEEGVDRAGDTMGQDHGFAFDVPSGARELIRPEPLTEMGRFNREAIAVDLASGVVYQTEDRADGLLYRFIPTERGVLRRGGRLQALRLPGLDVSDTSNRDRALAVGGSFPVAWVDLEDATSPRDDLRVQGVSKGAATFSRGEGIWSGPGVVYFAATSGGANRAGQIWRYRPSPLEGTPGESTEPGTLELFVEPNDTEVLESADNLTIAPWGDLIVCEDGPNGNFLRGVTPEGRLYTFARNSMNNSELAGATFSPDLTTLFVNIQRPGLTLAITGPWDSRERP